MRALDPEAVEAFVLVSDLKSFTRAAEALNSTQSAISLKLKRLEDRLGRRLIERTPRLVKLSADGVAFLEAARGLVSAHQRALGSFTVEQRRLIVGISHHVVGPDLPLILKRVSAADPALVIEIRVETSRAIVSAFESGELDAAIVLRHDDNRRDGETLLEERFGWIAAPEFEYRPGEPLRLATQVDPCSVRAMAVKTLDDAGIPWTEVFVGGGVMTIGAAVSAGLAVAALARRVAPPGTIDVGPQLGLPPLPARELILCSSATDRRSRTALKALGAAFRATGG